MASQAKAVSLLLQDGLRLLGGAVDEGWLPAEGSKGAQPSAVSEESYVQRRSPMSGTRVQLQQVLDGCDQD